MAIYLDYAPRPPLSDFIEAVWFFQDERPTHTVERRLPDGALSLVINLRDDLIRMYDPRDQARGISYRGGVIRGPYSTAMLLDTACLQSVIGVQFKPGGASAFLPLPAVELHNMVVSLDGVFSSDARILRDQLLDAPTPQSCFHVLETFLLARLAPARNPHDAVIYALGAFERALMDAERCLRVSVVADRLGMSQTRFVQLFREAVGLTPKQFFRLRRFQKILRSVEGSSPVVWAELAGACGYSDQAHLIHEFQAFSALTPGAYLAVRGAHRNHVPLAG